MSLEQKIDELKSAVEALTAKISGAATSTASDGGKTEKAEKPAGKAKAVAYTPEFTKEEMQALMNRVRQEISMDKAKEIRDTVGKVKTIGDLADPKVIDDVARAATAALEAHEGEEAM